MLPIYFVELLYLVAVVVYYFV